MLGGLFAMLALATVALLSRSTPPASQVALPLPTGALAMRGRRHGRCPARAGEAPELSSRL